MVQLSPEKTRASRHAVLADSLAGTLDAFDFFVVVFLFDTLARQFGVTKREIVWTYDGHAGHAACWARLLFDCLPTATAGESP